MIPALVFIHRGYDPYLEYSLRQARAFNPEMDIFLIGDVSNSRFDFVEHRDIAEYAQRATAFAEIYEHRSSNRYDMELFCFQRWFIVRDVMRRHDILGAFVCDSDVLIYTDLASFAERVRSTYALALSIPATQDVYRWSVSAHVSYWARSTIDEFCDFLFESFISPRYLALYLEKWQHHLKSEKSGGICDMTSLYLFAREIYSDPILNVARAREYTFDNNIYSAENEYENEYAIKNAMKEIRWKGEIPYCLNVRENRLVRFDALHFQGNAKLVMYRYYRGPAFAGRTKARYHTYVTRLSKGLSRRLCATWAKALAGGAARAKGGDGLRPR